MGQREETLEDDEGISRAESIKMLEDIKLQCNAFKEDLSKGDRYVDMNDFMNTEEMSVEEYRQSISGLQYEENDTHKQFLILIKELQ